MSNSTIRTLSNKMGNVEDRLQGIEAGIENISRGQMEIKAFWVDSKAQKSTEDKESAETVTTVVQKVDVIDRKVSNIQSVLNDLVMGQKRMQDNLTLSAEENSLKRNPEQQVQAISKPSPSRGVGFAGLLGALLTPAALAFAAWLGDIKTRFASGLAAALKVIDNIPNIISKDLSKLDESVSSILKRLNLGKFAAEEGRGVSRVAGADASIARRAESTTAKEAEKINEMLAKAGRGVKSGVVKLTGKALRVLRFLEPIRGALRLVGKFAPIIAFLDPIIQLCKLAKGDDDASWATVERSFITSLGAWFGGEAGALLGATIGSVIPIFGTIAGGILGAFGGAAAGEYAAKKLAEMIFDGKDGNTVWQEVKSDAIQKAKEGMSIATGAAKTTVSSVSSFLGYNMPPVTPNANAVGKSGPTSNTIQPNPNLKGVGSSANAQKAMDFFLLRGWKKEQAAAIVANLQAESGPNLKIDIVGDSGQAYGIGQWHADRQRLFKDQFKKDIRGSSLEDQLAFVDYELNTTEKRAGDLLRQTSDPGQAAAIIDKYYERSKGLAREQRVANAITLTGGDIKPKTVMMAQASPPKAPESSSGSKTAVVVANGRSPGPVQMASTQNMIPSPGHPYHHEDNMAAYFNMTDPYFNLTNGLNI